MTTEQMDAMDDHRRGLPPMGSNAMDHHLRGLPVEARSVNTYSAQAVEAILIREQNLETVARWCGGRVIPPGQHSAPGGVKVPHLDAPFSAMEGDFLIRTSTGQYTKMAEREFRDTYARAVTGTNPHSLHQGVTYRDR